MIRRGSVAVGMLIALVAAQLVVVGLVLAGARDHDLTVLRAEGTRAFYAAEAGCACGLREMMLGEDEDADGGIGSISDDDNDANNPDLGLASLFVELDEADEQTTLTSEGHSGGVRIEAELVLEGG